MCSAEGLDDFCWKDLYAICRVETGCDAEKVGDSGNSYGLFQIHRGYHPDVTMDEAVDVKFAASWTLKRLMRYGYPEYRTKAIQCHNSCTANNGYAEKVKAEATKVVDNPI